MSLNYIYASFEIGNKSWKFVVTEMIEDKIHVLFKKVADCNFVYKSKLIDPKGAAKVLDKLIVEANQFLQLNINKVILVIPVVSFDVVNVEKSLSFQNRQQVSAADINKLVNNINVTKNHYTNLVPIMTIPNYYVLDDNNKMGFRPIGKYCNKIALNSNVYYSEKATYDSFMSIFSYSKAQKLETVLDIFAAAYQVAPYEVLREGAIVVDYGHLSTKISLLNGQKIVSSFNVNCGGVQIDRDINYILGHSETTNAEKLKLKFNDLLIKQDEGFIIKENAFPVDSKKEKFVNFTSKDVLMIEIARIKESFSKIFKMCHEMSNKQDIPVIITGGSAGFKNLEVFLKNVFPFENIHIYTPSQIGAKRSDLTNALGGCYFKHLNNLEQNKKEISVKNIFGMTFTLKQKLGFLKKEI